MKIVLLHLLLSYEANQCDVNICHQRITSVHCLSIFRAACRNSAIRLSGPQVV